MTIMRVDKGHDDVVVGFTFGSYDDHSNDGDISHSDNYENAQLKLNLTFVPDQLWDNDEEWDTVEQAIREEVDVNNEEGVDSGSSGHCIDHQIPNDDELILDITRTWVSLSV